jgi:hypothetical protein
MTHVAPPTRTVDFVDSTDMLADPAALRDRADNLGYLFFGGLLPAGELAVVRRRFLEVLHRRGWLAAGAGLMDGIVDAQAFAAVPREDLDFCGVGVGAGAYREVQHIEEFHRLAHHPNLLGVFAALFDAPTLPHPRNIARIMIPGPGAVSTPPHQDFIHVQGSQHTWTAWFPLGDCPMALGSLSVLVGSHREGVLSYKQAVGAGGLEAYLCDLDYAWAVGDFAVGDVLIFTSQTVHRALPNQYADRIRLSCDFRYQAADGPIEPRSLQPHCQVDSWENIYADWRDHSLSYYWANRELQLSQWDEAIRWQKNRIC